MKLIRSFPRVLENPTEIKYCIVHKVIISCSNMLQIQKKTKKTSVCVMKCGSFKNV